MNLINFRLVELAEDTITFTCCDEEVVVNLEELEVQEHKAGKKTTALPACQVCGCQTFLQGNEDEVPTHLKNTSSETARKMANTTISNILERKPNNKFKKFSPTEVFKGMKKGDSVSIRKKNK